MNQIRTPLREAVEEIILDYYWDQHGLKEILASAVRTKYRQSNRRAGQISRAALNKLRLKRKEATLHHGTIYIGPESSMVEVKMTIEYKKARSPGFWHIDFVVFLNLKQRDLNPRFGVDLEQALA